MAENTKNTLCIAYGDHPSMVHKIECNAVIERLLEGTNIDVGKESMLIEAAQFGDETAFQLRDYFKNDGDTKFLCELENDEKLKLLKLAESVGLKQLIESCRASLNGDTDQYRRPEPLKRQHKNSKSKQYNSLRQSLQNGQAEKQSLVESPFETIELILTENFLIQRLEGLPTTAIVVCLDELNRAGLSSWFLEFLPNLDLSRVRLYYFAGIASKREDNSANGWIISLYKPEKGFVERVKLAPNDDKPGLFETKLNILTFLLERAREPFDLSVDPGTLMASNIGVIKKCQNRPLFSGPALWLALSFLLPMLMLYFGGFA